MLIRLSFHLATGATGKHVYATSHNTTFVLRIGVSGVAIRSGLVLRRACGDSKGACGLEKVYVVIALYFVLRAHRESAFA